MNNISIRIVSGLVNALSPVSITFTWFTDIGGGRGRRVIPTQNPPSPASLCADVVRAAAGCASGRRGTHSRDT